MTDPRETKNDDEATNTSLKVVALVCTWVSLNIGALAVQEEDIHRSPSAYFPSRSARRLYRPYTATLTHGLNSQLLSAPATAKRYPLLVFLHGAGQRGDDNVRQLEYLPEQMASPAWRTRYPCYLLVPQCPDGSYWGRHLDELESLIEQVVHEYPIDRSRIYLTGLSMGGFGTWELAARRPNLFAAVVPICGGGDPDWAPHLTNIPIWAVHGDADKAVTVDHTRDMIDAIQRLGGSPRYTELRGVGHNSWTQSYRDPEGVITWMFSQNRSIE